jgi:hypothetical protein
MPLQAARPAAGIVASIKYARTMRKRLIAASFRHHT